MKKLLVLLPLVAVLAGCSASMRGGARVYVVREPSVFPAYSWSHAWYGCPLRPLHAWIGLGYMNPFFYYEFYMSYCRQYGAGAFVPDEPDYYFSEGPPASYGQKKMKVTPKAKVMKPRPKLAATVALDKPALRPDRESGRSGRWSSAPRSEKEREVETLDPGRSGSPPVSSIGSSSGSESRSVSSRESSSRDEKSSRGSKKK
ncbi:MAG: hypothetical protein WBB73_11675 [Candidatus Aminicenantaceae bacterium]